MLTFYSSFEENFATTAGQNAVVAPWRLVRTHQADLAVRAFGSSGTGWV